MSAQQGLLAISFQEAFTAIVRVRAGREHMSDAAQFRTRMRHTLQVAAHEARDRGGYAPADVRSATFAVVAFLDESVLNSGAPVFADWTRKPLQEELFGTHIAGDVFFDNMRSLLSQPDSLALADVLEVYDLCLLLGFAGRYSGGRRGEVAAIVVTVRDRIRRIRPAAGSLSPCWLPDTTARRARRDLWTRSLAAAALVLVCAAILLFSLYRLQLGSAAEHAQRIALEVKR